MLKAITAKEVASTLVCGESEIAPAARWKLSRQEQAGERSLDAFQGSAVLGITMPVSIYGRVIRLGLGTDR